MYLAAARVLSMPAIVLLSLKNGVNDARGGPTVRDGVTLAGTKRRVLPRHPHRQKKTPAAGEEPASILCVRLSGAATLLLLGLLLVAA